MLTSNSQFTTLLQLVLYAFHNNGGLVWRHNGLGCLQAYLWSSQEGKFETRLHIWSNELKHPGVEDTGAIHDHRFDMQSTVLAGRIHHVEIDLDESTYGVTQRTPYRIYEVINARKGDPSVPKLVQEKVVYLNEYPALMVPQGCSYDFKRRRYHYTFLKDGDFTVTLVTKLRQLNEYARILVPANTEPHHVFNPKFNKILTRDEMDPYIERAHQELLKVEEKLPRPDIP